MQKYPSNEVIDWEKAKLMIALYREANKRLEAYEEADRLHIWNITDDPFEVVVIKRHGRYSITLEQDEMGAFWEILPNIGASIRIPLRDHNAIGQCLMTITQCG